METVKNKILKVLILSEKPLAEHEFPFCGTNSSCLTRELRYMQVEGIVKGERRFDQSTGKLKKFKEWSIIDKQFELFKGDK